MRGASRTVDFIIILQIDSNEVKIRIEQLGEEKKITVNANEGIFSLLQEFLDWRRKNDLS
jgi:hypothetical protein